MASKQFGIDLDLMLNQLLEARVENGAAFTSGGAGSEGRLVYDTSTNRLGYDDGTTIREVANLNDITSGVNFIGGYNAATNTPDLTTSPNAISKGDLYIVTVAGTFFGEELEVGDSLFARVDDPSSLADWVILQGNVVYATETIAGVIRLATQAETDAGTDDTTAITPLKLRNASFIPKKYISPSTAVGLATPVTFTHNLNTTNPVVSIINTVTNEEIVLKVSNFTANTLDITKNGANLNVIVTVIG
jgi:hypothetical protein